MKPLVLVIAVALLVTGCSRVDRDPEPVAEEPEAPAVECITVSAAALEGIQWGLDDRQPGFEAVRAVAIKNPSSSTSWFVAAKFVGPGVDGVGVWSTLQDPVTAELVAYTSVDGYAAEFSSYMQPAGYSAALDGVDEVRECLN